MRGTPIDFVIVIVYFVGILAFGSFFARYTKSTKDFFFGGQRFAWWLIAASLVATGIGSYSFIKYAQAGYLRGMSSTMTYLNDWLMIPLFMFGWLPIIYFARIRSVPEYFERRFGKPQRLLANAAENCNACGAGATAATMAAAKKLGKTEGILLAHTNSNVVMMRNMHTTSADSVGYAAIIF